jgi:hypothetical protein
MKYSGKWQRIPPAYGRVVKTGLSLLRLLHVAPQYTGALPLTVRYPQWLRAANMQMSHILFVYIGTQLEKQCYHTGTAL